MTRDDELWHLFEAGVMPPGGLSHADHVRLAWICLRREPLLAALGRLTTGLRRLAASVGKPEGYHETITWAYVLLINERLERHGRDLDWETFTGRNADLLARKGAGSALVRYYQPETLRSELARKVYLLPDRAAPLRIAADGDPDQCQGGACGRTTRGTAASAGAVVPSADLTACLMRPLPTSSTAALTRPTTTR